MISIIKATKIHMKTGCRYSEDVLEIDSIYLTGCREEGFYKKEVVHDYLKNNPHTIVVDRTPYPYVIPEVSSNGEKYVRSEPDYTTRDNLLSLPRE